MRNETTVEIAAPPEAVWKVLLDIEAWPSLTPSMTSVEKLDAGPLRVGTRVRIRQPKLPPAVWTVSDLVDGERFVWTATGPGFRTTAGHEVLRVGASTHLRLYVEQSGPLGGLVARLGRRLTDRYIALEAQGIKRRAEAQS